MVYIPKPTEVQLRTAASGIQVIYVTLPPLPYEAHSAIEERFSRHDSISASVIMASEGELWAYLHENADGKQLVQEVEEFLSTVTQAQSHSQ